MFENYERVSILYKNKSTQSSIYELRDKLTNKHYAAKIIGPIDDQLKNIIFNRELSALKVLNKYDNIVTLYHHEIGIRKSDKRKVGVLLLEYIQGKNLGNIELEQLSGIQKYMISIELIDAIKNAHINNIIHRDIKPSNIMIQDKDRHVKIIDFGISKIKTCVDEGTVQDYKSKEYCAPEVSLRNETSELSDIYSLGAVIFYLFTNKKPPIPSQFENAIEKEQMNDELKKIIIGMTKENKAERTSDLDKIKTEMENIIKDLNYKNYKYYFMFSTDLLEKMKNKGIIKRSIRYNEFIHKVLPEDLNNCYGIIDKNNKYSFLGEQYLIKCIYKSNYFHVYDMYIPQEDVKLRFKKKSLEINGKFIFGEKNNTSNSNSSLEIMLDNHKLEYESKKNEDKMFYEYFNEWRKYLNDSIEIEKNKGVEFSFKSFKIEGNRLILEIDKFINKNIDDLTQDTNFIVEKESNGKIIVNRIGKLYNTEYEDGKTYLIINFTGVQTAGKLKNIIKRINTIKEDYLYKIGAYKKQLFAISQLEDDNYEAKNLKEIILDIREAENVNEIKRINFKSDRINEYQKNAVKKFMASENISLVQGPPGTGKTTVINEIVYQILRENRNDNIQPKILIVSQSHTAVDNILEGLIKSNPNINIFRVGDDKNISQSVRKEFTLEVLKNKFINNIIKKCTESKQDYLKLINNSDYQLNERVQKIISIQDEWMERLRISSDVENQIIDNSKIIAGTCVGFASNPNIRETVFDYVIIDEAAKATTPELLVSIVKSKKILLVGDQMQLPPYVEKKDIPWVDNDVLKRLKKSLFTSLYEILPQTHKERLSTQYRMHPNIGNLISKVFYDGEVDSGISAKERQHSIEKLKKYSIVWYDTSNCGEYAYHTRTPAKSYFNNCEAEIIKNFIKENYKAENDIGIITGYSAQRDLISKKIANYNLNKNILVDTVDAFQGREKDIIIYSTVRSNDKNLNIGFQKESERINVAFSRAKRLLIIVGSVKMFYNWDIDGSKFPEIIDYIKKNENECLIIDYSEVLKNENK